MAYNPDALYQALEARALTASDLSRRLGLPQAEVESAFQSTPEPAMGLVTSIANQLSLPRFVFFMSKVPPLSGALPDFRSDKPRLSEKAKATVDAIQFAEGVQRALHALEAPRSQELPVLTATTEREIDAFALRARKFFGISLEDQLEAKDARAFYTICRKKIEDAGVYVLHASFPKEDGSGFCLADSAYPVVVVNTKSQTRGRRLFTLVHELAHVLMGKSGISDPFLRRNAIERICNRFAGSFLVPASFVSGLLKNARLPKEPELDDVALAARRFKISQQASVLRLEQCGVFSEGSHGRWLAAVKKLGNPDFLKEGGGGPGGPPPQEKTKLAKYGFRFAATFDALLRAGAITAINLYRSTGLKPAYQRAYFDYAKSLTPQALRDLELGDE